MKTTLLIVAWAAGSAMAQNTGSFLTGCATVWKAAIPTLVEKGFHPTLMDKDSFTATLASDMGVMKVRRYGYGRKGQQASLGQWTDAGLATFTHPGTFSFFKIDSASLVLIEDQGQCTATLKMIYEGDECVGFTYLQGPDQPGKCRWYMAPSNGRFEATLLDELRIKVTPPGFHLPVEAQKILPPPSVGPNPEK